MLRIVFLAAAATAVVATARGEVATPPGASAAGGEAFARQRCAGCHAVGLDEDPGSVAPRFREIARTADPARLLSGFAWISAHGVGAMAPIEITPDQASDLAAYFATLNQP